MARSVFRGARVAGIAAAVPKYVVDNAKDHTFLSEDEARKVIALTGVPQYRRAPPTMCASDLCEAAAKRLFAGLGRSFDEVDAVIFGTMTPDYRVPSTACVLQHRLGCATTSLAYDFNMGCSAYIVGLYNACALVSTGLKRVLLLTGDTQSRLIHSKDKNVALLLGDGGTATLIEAAEPEQVIKVEVRTDGSRFENLYVPAGGFRRMSDDASRAVTQRQDGGFRSDDHLYMNGMEVFKFSSSDVVQTLRDFMDEGGVSVDDIDLLFLHQANKFMTDKIASKLKFDRKRVPYSMGTYGNTGSASIPLTITHHFSTEGAEERFRALLCGFGVGLSWGVADISFEGLYTPPLVECD